MGCEEVGEVDGGWGRTALISVILLIMLDTGPFG